MRGRGSLSSEWYRMIALSSCQFSQPKNGRVIRPAYKMIELQDQPGIKLSKKGSLHCRCVLNTSLRFVFLLLHSPWL